MNEINKAVFPVAGLGTRFLPATKALPKELLPIVDKPLIQYAAEEAINAGIKTLIFVTGRGKHAIEDHFDKNFELERILEETGKIEELEKVRKIIPDGVECVFVRQSEQKGLGHAVLCAQTVVGQEPFAVLLADDFIANKSDGVTAELVRAYRRTGKSQISVMEVNDNSIEKYGVVELDRHRKKVLGLIEKPKKEVAPSNLASIGRYVLNPEIFEILKHQKPGKAGEIQLSDAINVVAKSDNVEAVTLAGKRFDCGSVEGFVEATTYFQRNKSY